MSPRPRGPNPFDRWARSESGLHLPSRFVPGAAKRMHHIEKNGSCQCCCNLNEVEVECGVDTTVPKYLSVTLSDLPGEDYYGDGTYVFEHDPTETSYPCRWIYGDTESLPNMWCWPYSNSLCGGGSAYPAMMCRDTSYQTRAFHGYISGPTGPPGEPIWNWTESSPYVIGGFDCGGTSSVDYTGATASIYCL